MYLFLHSGINLSRANVHLEIDPRLVFEVLSCSESNEGTASPLLTHTSVDRWKNLDDVPVSMEKRATEVKT